MARDTGDISGQTENVPFKGQRDTRGHPLKGGCPSVPVSPAASPAIHIRRLASRLGRLSPNWGNPELFFEERDEIERAFRRLAASLENA